MTSPVSLHLQSLIGCHADYYGRPCRVVEVLADDGLLILETTEPLPPIQFNQYGQAGRRVNELIEVALYNADQHPSEDLLALLASLSAPAP